MELMWGTVPLANWELCIIEKEVKEARDYRRDLSMVPCSETEFSTMCLRSKLLAIQPGLIYIYI